MPLGIVKDSRVKTINLPKLDFKFNGESDLALLVPTINLSKLDFKCR